MIWALVALALLAGFGAGWIAHDVTERRWDESDVEPASEAEAMSHLPESVRSRMRMGIPVE